MNGLYQPFAGMTTGLTWGSITPATYVPTGYNVLFNASGYLYTQWIVTETLVELDITPQSVTDSVVASLTASTVANVPGTVGIALSKPFTKQMTFASGRVYKLGEYPFKYRIKTSEFLGIANMVYMNDTSGVFVGSIAENPTVSYPLVLNVETGDNSVLSQPLEIRIRQTFWVKCYGLSTETIN